MSAFQCSRRAAGLAQKRAALIAGGLDQLAQQLVVVKLALRARAASEARAYQAAGEDCGAAARWAACAAGAASDDASDA